MTLQRREFLRSTVVGLTSAAVGTSAARAASGQTVGRKVQSTDPFAMIPLTKEITCARIGFGMGMRGGRHLRALPPATSRDLLLYGYDLGMRLFDTADSYQTHPLVADAMKGKPRDSYSIISKFSPIKYSNSDKSPYPVEELVHRFLKELNTDYIDLLQLHCMIKPDWPTLFTDYMEQMEKLKKKGMIRAHGITTHSLVSVMTAAQIPWVDAIHVRMNTANTRMDGNWNDNLKALEACHNAGQGTVIMKVLGEGTIHDPKIRQQSTDAIVRLDAADVMVVGFESRAEIDEFVKNVSDTLKNMDAESKKV